MGKQEQKQEKQQKEQEEGDGQRGRGGAARRRCVLLRLALALWRGQLYRLADACARYIYSPHFTKQRPLALATAREGSCPPSPSTP